MNTIHLDVAIIGHGSAGGNARRSAEAAGAKKVATIESGTYGTTCAKVGCMPSKLLISAADSAYEAKHAKIFGVHVGEIQINGKEVMKRVREMRDFFVSFVVKSVEDISPEKRIVGRAKFVDTNTLQVDDHTIIKAKSIIIATGSTPFTPAFLSPVKQYIQTSDDIFYWDDLPKSVAVFGTGVIALELGQALSRLGVRVTIFGRSGRIGTLSGPGMQEVIHKTFFEELDIVCKPNFTKVHEEKNSAQFVFTDEKNPSKGERTEQYEVVLSCAGRTPNVKNLGLENTGIQLNQRGIPEFNEKTLQCGDSPIFISGDATGTYALLHEASDEGQIAGKNAALFAQGKNLENFTRREQLNVVFSNPQMAIAGKSFRDLQAEFGEENFVIGEVDMTRQGRAQVMAQNKGLIQVYAEKSSGKILGSELFSPRAEHFAHLISWAVAEEKTIDDLLKMPFYHPTFEEGLRTALRDARGKITQ